ncbi:MAG TPA: FMN-binding protein [Candidatus Limnocylindrales bacterium]
MPKRGAIALALTIIALVLLINFKTPSELGGTAFVPRAFGPGGSSPAAVAPARPGSAAAPGAGGGLSAPRPTATPRTPVVAGALHDGQVTGPAIDTRFGAIQVEVTISNGRISDVSALQLPFDLPRSAAISQYVEPILRSEALQAQSAEIDLVSGATYTSLGYGRSLQGALDQAHG